MISQIANTALRGAYTNSFSESKDVKQSGSANITKQGDTSKIEQLKEGIESGEYKIDLQALSKKIAEELL